MRFSLSLSLRSLMLTAFLVVSQLLFVIVLTDVLQKSQEKIEKQWRSENLIRLTFSLCRAASDMLVYVQLPDSLRDAAAVDPGSSVARARQETETLRVLASEDPLKREAVSKMLSANEHLYSLFDAVLNRPKDTGRIPDLIAARHFRRVLKRDGKNFFDAVEEIVAIEKARHDADNAYAATFSTVFNTLFAAVLASIIIALVLGFAYAVSIRRPLKHLSENGRLLSAQKELLPQLVQVDEFGKLDAILHATAREIDLTAFKERETIENAADLICTLDENGVFVSVNSFARKMLGMPEADFTGKNLNALTVAEQSLLADEQVRHAVNTSAVCQFELRMRRADGEIIDSRWSCLWSAPERKLFCVVRDVTEEKKIEQLKQDFTDMISHDLRSPLMSMGNSLTLLRSGVKGEIPEEGQKRIETSARNVEKLIVLVNDLLDFQKLKVGKMDLALEPIALKELIKDAADLVGEAAAEKAVQIELPENETIVLCDRNKLMQAAVNLISNAIKFSGNGGKVSIVIELEQQKVLLSVVDSGPGVSPEFEERIFEPFEQAPSGKKNEGTGLGLAICKLVVEAHGGKIRVANRTDSDGQAGAVQILGSVFTVELPLLSKEVTA